MQLRPLSHAFHPKGAVCRHWKRSRKWPFAFNGTYGEFIAKNCYDQLRNAVDSNKAAQIRAYQNSWERANMENKTPQIGFSAKLGGLLG